MRLAATAVLVCVAACHQTIELPTPPHAGSGTTVFLQGTQATWASHDAEGRFNDASVVLDPDVPLIALRYDCSSEILQLPTPLPLTRMPRPKAPLLPNESFAWEGGPEWVKLAEDDPLADEITRRMDWQAPELCATRVGKADYSFPPIPPNSLDVLSAFFALSEGGRAFLANPAGPAFTVDPEGGVEPVVVPGPVASGYGGAAGQFFLLTQDGEVFRGNPDFEFSTVASGLSLSRPDRTSDAYSANQLIGSPNGDDLMVVSSTGVSVLQPSGSWEHIVAPQSGSGLFDARWWAPGEFMVFGFDGTRSVFHLRTDGSVIASWAFEEQPIRFSSFDGRLFMTTIIGFERLGSTFELVEGQWQNVFDGPTPGLPVGLTESGDLLLAQINIRLSSFTRFGVFHAAIDSRCFEQEEESQRGGLIRDNLSLVPGVDLFFTQGLGLGRAQAPVVTLRTQTVAQRACGRTPPLKE